VLNARKAPGPHMIEWCMKWQPIRNPSIWTPFPTEASPPQWSNGFGFTLFAVTPLTSAGRVTLVAIPYWSIVATTGALPIVYLARMLRRRTRNRIGACVRCSYSLTGNTSGICPECGTADSVESTS